MATKKATEDNKKYKYWIALSYLDSAPPDILERAKDSGIECCTILHDKDINESETSDDTEELGHTKKAHRHWIFAFPNTTTFNHAFSVINKITNCDKVKGCSNIRGSYAYLTHKYDPDKYQYDSKDITHINGFAPENYFSLQAGEEDEAFQCIEKIIKEQDIEEYCDLIDYLGANFTDLARFARTHTLHIKAYLQSKHMKKRQAKRDYLLDLQIAEYERRVIDPRTGEVICQGGIPAGGDFPDRENTTGTP